ncbi:MAG: lysophospholipid acyltransferase family protein [Nitrospiraceae bacterium]|nr:MAG: lysophospholipid acyltransferase family protein [Nitrospiraceae bacterium]
MNKKKRKKKSKPLKVLEYCLAFALISAARVTPFAVMRFISTVLGDLLFVLISKRRTIAIENLSHALGREKSPPEIRRLARESCRSFFLTFLEIVRYRSLFSGPDAVRKMTSYGENLEALFLKAKKIHDQAGGCIFVTPHIGNWEVLPRVCSAIGIPLAIVARPLDNEYLERLIFRSRVAEGQFIIPKKNALFTLQKTLQKGTSIGMLPDQSTMKGMVVEFFGRPATTTPVPAILAITYKRPIVVTAACRAGKGRYEGFVSDPIWPGIYESEKAEIRRITEEMTRAMEAVIRKYPGQYLWMHNRWKTYRDKKEIMA